MSNSLRNYAKDVIDSIKVRRPILNFDAVNGNPKLLSWSCTVPDNSHIASMPLGDLIDVIWLRFTFNSATMAFGFDRVALEREIFRKIRQKLERKYLALLKEFKKLRHPEKSIHFIRFMYSSEIDLQDYLLLQQLYLDVKDESYFLSNKENIFNLLTSMAARFR